MKKLLAFIVLTALSVAAAPPRRLVMRPTGGITLGGEFPGAKGSREISTDEPVTAKINFDLTHGAYVGFVQNCHLTEGTTTFSFLARPSIPNTRLFVRTMDSKGRQHMRRIPNSISPGQWEERSVDLSKFQDSWGAGEAKIHWPITEIVIGIEVDKKHAIGSLELRDFIVTTTATRENMPSVSLQVTPSRFGALFYPEDPITIQYTVVSSDLDFKPSLNVTQTVKDWKDNVILSEKAVATSNENFIFNITAEKLKNQFGAFQLEINVVNASDPTDKTSYTTWFGRLPSHDPKPCPWVGTGLHSGHGWGHSHCRRNRCRPRRIRLAFH